MELHGGRSAAQYIPKVRITQASRLVIQHGKSAAGHGASTLTCKRVFTVATGDTCRTTVTGSYFAEALVETAATVRLPAERGARDSPAALQVVQQIIVDEYQSQRAFQISLLSNDPGVTQAEAQRIAHQPPHAGVSPSFP
jgi:hypothetical protein